MQNGMNLQFAKKKINNSLAINKRMECFLQYVKLRNLYCFGFFKSFFFFKTRVDLRSLKHLSFLIVKRYQSIIVIIFKRVLTEVRFG